MNVFKLFKTFKHEVKIGTEMYASLLRNIEASAWSRFNQMRIDRISTNIEPLFDPDEMRSYFRVIKTQTVTLKSPAPSPESPYVMINEPTDVTVYLDTERVYDLSESRILDEDAFVPLKEDYARLRLLKGGAVALTMVIFGSQAVIAWLEGDEVKAVFYGAAGATAVFGIVKSESTLFRIPTGGGSNFAGRSVKVGTAAAVAVGAILAGYELFAASQTEDGMRKLAHYEAAGAAVSDAVITAIPIYGAAIGAGWFLGAQVGVLVGHYLLGIAPNAVAYQIVSSPGSTIVFFFEYVFATAIPSAVAEDALSQLLNFLVDSAQYLNSNGEPALILFPRED